jgi:hypothetical protein
VSVTAAAAAVPQLFASSTVSAGNVQHSCSLRCHIHRRKPELNLLTLPPWRCVLMPQAV